MRYALLCYGSESMLGAWTREQDETVMADIAAVEQRLAAEGKLGPRARLMPTTAATTVRAGSAPVVIDGPYAETREQLLGLWVLDCASLEEAIEAARLLARVRGPGSGALEIRPIAAFDPGPGPT